MAGTPRGPVRLGLKKNRNRRIESDLQGHARSIDFSGVLARESEASTESGAYSSVNENYAIVLNINWRTSSCRPPLQPIRS